jgi:hypothetical protein
MQKEGFCLSKSWRLDILLSNIISYNLCEATFLKMEVICSSETSIQIWTTWCCIPEDANTHSHCWENLTSYIILIYF